MNTLFVKAFAKKVADLLIFGPEYKAPEYAYVRVTQTSKKTIYNDGYGEYYRYEK